MATVFLGLGSNLGDRSRNIHDALEFLKTSGVRIEKVSAILESDPVGGPPQGKYLNCVVKGETVLNPLDLLKNTQAIEERLGRVRSVLNGPRMIDIDILLYDQQKIDTPQLIIPHPRMSQRNFVMVPLKEIAPEVLTEISG